MPSLVVDKKNAIKTLLEEIKSCFDSGQEITNNHMADLEKAQDHFLQEVDDLELEVEYWLLTARAARALVEVDKFARAVFALEALVNKDLVNLQVFNYHYYAAIYYLEYSDLSMAYDHILSAQQIAVELDVPKYTFKVLSFMVVVFDRLGDQKTSLKIAQEVLKLANSPDEKFIANINLAENYRKLEKLNKSEERLIEANKQLELVDDRNLLRYKIMDFEKRAWLNFDLDKLSIAEKDFKQAIALAKKSYVPYDTYFFAMEGLGSIYYKQKDYEASIDLAKTVLTLETAGNDIKMNACYGMAKNYKALDDYKSAYKSLEEAHKLEQKIRSEKSDSKLKSWEARYNFNIERRDKEIALKEREIFELKNVKLKDQVKRGQMEMLQRLALAAEIRDDETSAHTRRVGKISTKIALILGLDEGYAKRLGFAAQFHDIGKIGIPDEILLKPTGLTPEEFEIMKQHTTIGSQILSNSEMGIMKMSEVIAVSHHERWDGSGYPKQLKGIQIPLEGRIVSVADAFDAMTSDRPYRKALDIEIVKDELMKGAGGQFDEVIVAEFLRWIEKNGVEDFNNISLTDVGEDISSFILDDDNDMAAESKKYLKTIYYSPMHADKEMSESKILVPV